METISIIPPKILEYFNEKLLSLPTPKFCDDSETFWKVYQYINKKLYKKCMRCPFQMGKFEKLFNEFYEVYGRAKAKEDEYKEKTGESLRKPFDYFRSTARRHKGVFDGIKYRS